jgi:hypothetical protein
VSGALEEDAGEVGEGREEREEEEEEGAEADVTVRIGHGEDAEKTGIAAQSREEKLQSDLFVLRQLNGAFAVYNDALREAQGGTEVSPLSMPSREDLFFSHTTPQKRLAEQLEQTDALLNKYINILSKSEKATRLIFDERWMGAEAVCGVIPLSLSFFFLALRRFSFAIIHRMKRSSRRRNANEKRSGFARKKSVDWRRSANRSGGRRRRWSVRCAKKWSGFNARRGIGLLLGAVAGCGVYVVRVHLCAQREGVREQVRHFLQIQLHIFPPLVLGNRDL